MSDLANQTQNGKYATPELAEIAALHAKLQAAEAELADYTRAFDSTSLDRITELQSRAEAAEAKLGDPQRDWPEHAQHENGNYQNRCMECGCLFIGHKRSPFCKVCWIHLGEAERKSLKAEVARLKETVSQDVCLCVHCNDVLDADEDNCCVACDLRASQLATIVGLKAEVARLNETVSRQAQDYGTSEQLRQADTRIAELEAGLSGLLNYAEKQTCLHEETHRGGTIWEICDMCGRKWADDRGGKPEYEEPEAFTNAHRLLNGRGE